MQMVNRLAAVAAATVVGGTLFASSASAGLILFMEDTVAGISLNVSDNGPNDGDPMPGLIVFTGPVGNFSINVQTAIASQSPLEALLTTSAVVSNLTAPSTMRIIVTESNFTAPLAGVSAATVMNPLNLADGAEIDFRSEYDDPAPGGPTLIGEILGATNASPALNESLFIGSLAAPFSLIHTTELRHLQSGLTTGYSATSRIVMSEPSAAGLLGLGLLGMALARRRARA